MLWLQLSKPRPASTFEPVHRSSCWQVISVRLKVRETDRPMPRHPTCSYTGQGVVMTSETGLCCLLVSCHGLTLCFFMYNLAWAMPSWREKQLPLPRFLIFAAARLLCLTYVLVCVSHQTVDSSHWKSSRQRVHHIVWLSLVKVCLPKQALDGKPPFSRQIKH